MQVVFFASHPKMQLLLQVAFELFFGAFEGGGFVGLVGPGVPWVASLELADDLFVAGFPE